MALHGLTKKTKKLLQDNDNPQDIQEKPGPLPKRRKCGKTKNKYGRRVGVVADHMKKKVDVTQNQTMNIETPSTLDCVCHKNHHQQN